MKCDKCGKNLTDEQTIEMLKRRIEALELELSIERTRNVPVIPAPYPVPVWPEPYQPLWYERGLWYGQAVGINPEYTISDNTAGVLTESFPVN